MNLFSSNDITRQLFPDIGNDSGVYMLNVLFEIEISLLASSILNPLSASCATPFSFLVQISLGINLVDLFLPITILASAKASSKI